MKIIMNPPYDGSLHLEVLSRVLKVFLDENTEVVSVQPVGWLQDILEEFKQKTELKKYGQDILPYLNKISEVFTASESNTLFGINSPCDLGIYYFAKMGGFDLDSFRLNTPEQKLVYKLYDDDKKGFKNHERFSYDLDSSKEFKFTFPILYSGTKGGSCWGNLCAKDKTTAFSYKAPDTKEKYVRLSFDTSVERDNFHSSLSTKLFQFYIRIARRATRTTTMLKFLPHFLNVKWEGKSGTIDGYKNPITDEMLYEYFGLTEEEIGIITNFLCSMNIN